MLNARASGRAGSWTGAAAPVAGTHLVLRAETLRGLSAGLHVPIPAAAPVSCWFSRRATAASTWGSPTRRTTRPIPDVPEPTEGEIGFLLDVLGSAVDVPVRRTDVIGAYAGLRPCSTWDTAATRPTSPAATRC